MNRALVGGANGVDTNDARPSHHDTHSVPPRRFVDRLQTIENVDVVDAARLRGDEAAEGRVGHHDALLRVVGVFEPLANVQANNLAKRRCPQRRRVFVERLNGDDFAVVDDRFGPRGFFEPMRPRLPPNLKHVGRRLREGEKGRAFVDGGEGLPV